MTHDEIVARVMRWLRGSQKHAVVLAEIGSDGRECPDLIAWKHGGACTLVECKVSRSDYARDAKKSFRRQGGMGSYRWFATPPGLVTVAELPVRWGLIEVGPKLVRIVVHPMPFMREDRNVRGETNCLISAVQRVTDGWGRKVFGEISPVHGQLDPHPTVGAALKAYRDELHSLRSKLARRDERISVLEREAAARTRGGQ